MKATFPSKREIADAAERLRRGELVAFPTETVYGLGAHALDAQAVERIFQAKGRPRTSPLIVHVASVEAARQLVNHWPDAAETLAARFWPGPLTLVLPKNNTIPDIVTAGLDTVGVRIPRHPVALALLREAAIPVAAPSANRFTRLSPTCAEHVRAAFPQDLLVLEGGDSEVGIESTVVALIGTPRLLRPGAVSRSQLEAVTGGLGDVSAADGPHESPGLHAQHYQPRTNTVWAGTTLPGGSGAYLWVRSFREAARSVQMPNDAAAFSARLYRTLHELDDEGWAWIAVEPLPTGEDWAAPRDRLQRAVARLP